jgi:hypothetical protein
MPTIDVHTWYPLSVNKNFDNALADLMKKVAAMRLRSQPGVEWFSKKLQERLSKNGEGLKNEADTQDAIDDVLDSLKKWAKRNYIVTKNQVQKDIQESNRNDIAESIAKYEAIRPFIEQCRLELFGTKQIPFFNDEKGFEKAKAWLEQTYKAQHDARTHYDVEIKGTAKLTKSALQSFDKATFLQSPDGLDFRKTFVKTVTEAERTFSPSFVVPSIPFNLNLDKHDFTIMVDGGTELYNLVSIIGGEAHRARWFTVTEIIRLIFFNLTYTKKLIETGYTLGPPSFDPDHPNSITITIRGSVSEDEVLKAYRGQLKERRLKVRKKSLSYQAQKVLIFVNEHRANKTWDELTAMWNTECKRDKKLKPYGAKSRGGLLQAFNRAVAQVSWKNTKP